MPKSDKEGQGTKSKTKKSSSRNSKDVKQRKEESSSKENTKLKRDDPEANVNSTSRLQKDRKIIESTQKTKPKTHTKKDDYGSPTTTGKEEEQSRKKSTGQKVTDASGSDFANTKTKKKKSSTRSSEEQSRKQTTTKRDTEKGAVVSTTTTNSKKEKKRDTPSGCKEEQSSKKSTAKLKGAEVGIVSKSATKTKKDISNSSQIKKRISDVCVEKKAASEKSKQPSTETREVTKESAKSSNKKNGLPESMEEEQEENSLAEVPGPSDKVPRNTTLSNRMARFYPSFPYRWIGIPFALVVIGFVMFTVASYSCKTFEVTTPFPDGSTVSESFGYWAFEIDGECVEYKNIASFLQSELEDALEDFDDYYEDYYEDYFEEIEDEVQDNIVDTPHFKTARAFVISGTIIGGFLIIFMSTLFFQAFPDRHRNSIFAAIVTGCIFLLVCSVFLFMGLGNEFVCKEDDSKCKPNGPGYCTIVAFLFFLAAAVSVIILCHCGALVPRTFSNHVSPMESAKEHEDEELGE